MKDSDMKHSPITGEFDSAAKTQPADQTEGNDPDRVITAITNPDLVEVTIFCLIGCLIAVDLIPRVMALV